MRPNVFSPKPPRMMWLDSKTGKGIDSDGRLVTPMITGRRTTPTLADLLNTAANGDVEWIMLTGPAPKVEPGKDHYLAEPTPGWAQGPHWLEDDPTGRYQNELTKKRVEISLARAWFGELNLSPAQALTAWNALRHFLHKAEGKMLTPMKSPGATGAMLWGWGIPKNFDPQPLDSFVADQIHATSGQHHIEHLVAGRSAANMPDCVPLIDPKATPTMTTFAHSDGRFMYAALCNELGVGPARELRRDEAADLLRESPYAKARYRVKFTVPGNWDHVGILGVQNPDTRDSWYYPNRPGATAETWADNTELVVAAKHGWIIDPLEAVQFTEKTRPLDTFAARITRIREEVAGTQNVDPMLIKAVTAAFRNILLHGIGRFATRGRNTMFTVDTYQEIPEEYRDTAREAGTKYTYRRRAEMSDTQKTFYHPELAAQVWGYSRARVLDGPAANGMKSGALHVNPRTLIAIEGDAIYTTETPKWALPVQYGGGDDGKTGRIRLQGLLQGEMKMPTTKDQRDVLKKKAAAAGPEAAYES